ncbi:hypothetical protein NL676_023876 [Syzygium grande]|nr:hypothetical protein NL676_023876 [Syzygium grande]
MSKSGGRWALRSPKVTTNNPPHPAPSLAKRTLDVLLPLPPLVYKTTPVPHTLAFTLAAPLSLSPLLSPLLASDFF